MRSYCFALAAPLALAGAEADAQQPEAISETAVAESDIRVVGVRGEPTGTVVSTGLRIPARSAAGPFPGIASATGVPGFTPGSGMDPSSQFTRTITETQCRSDDPLLSEAAACRLVPIQRLVAAGDYEEALSALDRLASDETATDQERYVAAVLQYQIAAARGEASDREDALRAMLATAAMPAASRPAALRTLVALALRRGDTAAASRLLVELLALVPEDTRSLVNLAAIRAEAGDRSEAATLVGRAIEIARRRGDPVPAEWLSFAAATP